MLDYLGGYAKVLKYDAVPTLYLPSPASIIIKSNIDDPVNVSIQPESLVTAELKNIIVYTLPAQEQPTVATFMPSAVQQFNDTEVTANVAKPQHDEPAAENSEKYNCIQSSEQLESTRRENLELQKKMDSVKPVVDKLRYKAKEKFEACKRSGQELNRLRAQCDSLQTSSMSLQEQKSILTKVFSESQIKILSGKKKIYWSNDDMAIGYTIRHMSNKRCYTYLTKNLHIPLPALSSIKRWATLKKTECKAEEEKKDDTFEASD